jgi:BirA family biotin operon repressor/biotin-[acetyl-CoA-carboxylase] ligase
MLGSGGLSLAVAVGVLRALQQCGVEELGLKWPNDIYFQGRKLAGILVDLAGESTGFFQVIIGIGINLRIPANAATTIDQPWADLSQCGIDVDRNRLAALVLDALLPAIEMYLREGLPAFAEEWKRYDLIEGHTVELRHGNAATVSGIARGIDPSGALLIEQNGTIRPFHAGEVSVRLS